MPKEGGDWGGWMGQQNVYNKPLFIPISYQQSISNLNQVDETDIQVKLAYRWTERNRIVKPKFLTTLVKRSLKNDFQCFFFLLW